MKRIFAFAIAAVLLAGPVLAAEAEHLPKQKWTFNGPFGTIDTKAALRGLQVYKEVCSACHSLNLLAYRHLGDLGMSASEIKAYAAEAQVLAGPADDGSILNDSNELRRRPGRPSDHFPAPFLNPKAAAAANGGAAPPDLSVMAKAREGGPDYIFALLALGYKNPPADVKMVSGKSYNEYFPGHQISMPKPLSADQVTYADGTKATVEQMVRDVATFLTWAAEPTATERKRMGFKVLIFLVVFTALLYALKRQIWAKLH